MLAPLEFLNGPVKIPASRADDIVSRRRIVTRTQAVISLVAIDFGQVFVRMEWIWNHPLPPVLDLDSADCIRLVWRRNDLAQDICRRAIETTWANHVVSLRASRGQTRS